MRKITSILVPFLTLFISIDYVLAGGLLIKTNSQEECSRLCEDMVFDCNSGVWTSSGWCLLWQDSKPPTIDSSLAVKTPSKEECESLSDNTGLKLWWKKDVYGEGGWCIEGNAPVTKFKADLSRVYKSDQHYGDIHWQKGWYGNANKTITITKQYWDTSKNEYVVEGHWGRKNAPATSGGFKFLFDSPCSFKGKWWYTNRKSKTNWSGKCK
ncbi:MAG: hypothetical protein GY941_09005 [Planctomycetes bacterium]|nr:hypothetical protein [Planctomycetota bacterium]